MKVVRMRKSLCIAAMQIMVILCTNEVISDDWPMFLHDISHTNYSEDAAPDTPYLLWTFDVGEEIYSSPIVKNNRVYIGNENRIISIDAEMGTIYWENENLSIMDSTMAISDNRLIIGAYNKVIAMDYNNNKILWEYKVKGESDIDKPPPEDKLEAYIASSPIFFEGKIYIGAGPLHIAFMNPEPETMDEYNVYCIDEATGKKEWYFTTKDFVRSSPSLSNGYLFILSDKLYVIDSSNGNIKWKYGETSVRSSSSPVIINSKVVANFTFGDIHSNQLKILALDEYTGDKLWSFIIEKGFSSSPGAGYNKIYIHPNDGKIYSLDEFTGEKIWEFQTETNVEKSYRKLYFRSSPAVADGKVFVGSVDGNFYCLDAETGKLMWKYKTGGPIYSSPAISDGKVFIASTDGKLYAFGIDPETYFTKAKKYFAERQYEKAKDYYSGKSNVEMVEKIEEKLKIAEKMIIEDKPRQEALAKANELIEKGGLYLSKNKFKNALASFKEAETTFKKYGDEYEIKLCGDRINYTERRIKEQNNKFMLIGGILLFVTVGILILLKLKKKKS